MSRRAPRRGSLVARIRAVGGVAVACVSTKGGVGKSTLAYNLAGEYARRGARVLLIDADIQATTVDAATVRTRPESFEVMPYPHDTIWQDLERLANGVDVVVIDGQGRHERTTRAVVAAVALQPHGVILVPVSASSPDVWATKRDMGSILDDVAEAGLSDHAPRVRTVLTRYDPREVMTDAARSALAAAPVLAPPTRADMQRHAVYVQALNAGEAVCEYAPRSAAAAEMAELATEVAELALTDPTPSSNRVQETEQ